MLTFPTEPCADVLILGAGFSKALSGAMPLTDELGDEAVDLVRAQSPIALPNHFSGGRFEAWLSRLAEEQPDLTVAENLVNRTVFELTTEAIASVLEDRVAKAKDEALSHAWLFDLLGTLHARRATVITFNQDTLIEHAVNQAEMFCWDQRFQSGKGRSIVWWDCLDGLPPFPPTRYGPGIPHPTFRLLKLHGSTNWYWRPGDESGATTACWFLPGELKADQALPNEKAARRRELPGRVPLIVPPTAGKAPYYRTPMLNQLWQDSREAIQRHALRLSLVGYSLPLTDLVTSGMLSDALADDSHVEVVNPYPAPVVENLRRLGIEEISVQESAREFAERYVETSCRELVSALRSGDNLTGECLLLAGQSVADCRKVIETRCEGDELELVIERGIPPYVGTNVSPDGAEAPLALSSVLDRLSGVERLSVLTSSGEKRPVIGIVSYLTATGAATRWQVLLTARPVALDQACKAG